MARTTSTTVHEDIAAEALQLFLRANALEAKATPTTPTARRAEAWHHAARTALVAALYGTGLGAWVVDQADHEDAAQVLGRADAYLPGPNGGAGWFITDAKVREANTKGIYLDPAL